MFNLNFALRNPWTHGFDNLWCRSYATPFEHKFIELEFVRDCILVSFGFSWTVRQDHAGLDLEAGLFGYGVHFNFYDGRHWDFENNCWEVYGQSN